MNQPGPSRLILNLGVLCCTLWAWLPAAQAEELVEVGHARQLRGVWIASVANMHWPSRAGLTPSQQRQEMRWMLDQISRAGLNAVFFQVRPEGDALYRSKLEPWSRFLSGRQGQDPGYDPLQELTQEAHARGIEVHAWLNPFRAQAVPPPPASEPPVPPHLAATQPLSEVTYGNLLWMNPASAVVKERLVEVCLDLTRRYDLDGLHFDDYFYPYPEGDRDFPDQDSYAASGTGLSLGDWRRTQVNQAIKDVSMAIAAEKPYLRFGISPFGIPAPQKPDQISGLDQYEKLYADTQHWMDQGWVDYLAPQLYWPTTRPAQAYEPLLQWWKEHAREGRYIFPGLNLAALGTRSEWSLDEFRRQLELAAPCQGYILWNLTPVLENRQNLREDLLAGQPALPPPLAHRRQRRVQPPEIGQEGSKLSLTDTDAVAWKAFTLYSWRDQSWRLFKIVRTHQLVLPSGRWAIATVTRDGCESLGRVVTVAESDAYKP